MDTVAQESWYELLFTFVEHYLYHFPFQLLHLAVWIFALLQLRAAFHSRKECERKYTDREAISRDTVELCERKIKKYDGTLEMCASLFIFVGLTGTIYGFAVSVPRLSHEAYTFEDLARALSTSAFGILWSVLLVVVKTVVHDAPANRFLDAMRQFRSQEPLEQIVERLGTAISGPLREAVDGFAGAVETFTRILDELRESMTGAVTSLDRTSRAVENALAGINDVVKETRSLSAVLAKQLDAVFRDAAIRLDGVLARVSLFINELAQLPDRTLATVTAAADSLTSRLDDAQGRFLATLRELEGSIRHTAQDLLQQMQAAFDAAQALPANVAAEAVEATKQYLAHWREQHEAALAELRRVGADTADAQLKAVTEALDLLRKGIERLESVPEQLSLKLIAASERYLKHLEDRHQQWLEELRRTGREVVEQQIRTLEGAAGTLREQAGELDQKLRDNLVEQQKLVEDAVHSSLTKVLEILDSYRRGLEEVTASLPEQIRSTQEQLIFQTTECTKRAAELSEELKSLAGAAPRLLDRFHGDLLALDDAAGKVRDAADGFARFRPVASMNELADVLKRLNDTLLETKRQLEALAKNLQPRPLRQILLGLIGRNYDRSR